MNRNQVAASWSGNMIAKRDDGFYWVRWVEPGEESSKVLVVEWSKRDGWQIPGSDESWDDEEFVQLGDKLVAPEA